jgi:hypothetical protein
MLLVKLQKEKSLRAIGRWRLLINKSQQSSIKTKKLRIAAKWRMLATKIVRE